MPEANQTDTRPYYFRCPGCRQNQSFYSVPGAGISDGSLPRLLAELFLYLLLGSHTGPPIQCARCGHVFPCPSRPVSPVRKVIALAWCLVIGVAVGAVLIRTNPSLAPAIDVQIQSGLRQFGRIYSAFPMGTTAILMLIPVSSTLVSMFCDRKHRKRVLAGRKFEPPLYTMNGASE